MVTRQRHVNQPLASPPGQVHQLSGGFMKKGILFCLGASPKADIDHSKDGYESQFNDAWLCLWDDFGFLVGC